MEKKNDDAMTSRVLSSICKVNTAGCTTCASKVLTTCEGYDSGAFSPVQQQKGLLLRVLGPRAGEQRAPERFGPFLAS